MGALRVDRRSVEVYVYSPLAKTDWAIHKNLWPRFGQSRPGPRGAKTRSNMLAIGVTLLPTGQDNHKAQLSPRAVTLPVM
jgi:hypothetical protein